MSASTPAEVIQLLEQISNETDEGSLFAKGLSDRLDTLSSELASRLEGSATGGDVVSAAIQIEAEDMKDIAIHLSDAANRMRDRIQIVSN